MRKSPKAAPRKLSPSVGQSPGQKEASFTPKQFHGQKPDTSGKDNLLTTPMIVPAIGMLLSSVSMIVPAIGMLLNSSSMAVPAIGYLAVLP